MRPVETLAVAASALGRAKTRSLLTVLGIIIGVAAVIAMVSIGEGARLRIARTFESMGTNMLSVSSSSLTAGGVRAGGGTRSTLTWADVDAIGVLPGVLRVAPAMRSGAQIVAEGGNWQTSVTGTTPPWFEIRNWKLARGDLFTAADVTASRKVALLGETVVTNLFGAGAPAVGETIRINRIPFVVVGVLARKGSGPMGQDYDDTVVIPSTTMASKIAGGLQKYLRGEILVSAASPELTATTRARIEEVLRERHRLTHGEDDDFFVRDMAEIASAAQESTTTITSLLAGVALVSLIVGGIGVMNIMLVSVTERTREIGLRMAVGATPANVLSQFLVESLVLAVAGGLLGIAVGTVAARTLAARLDLPMLVRVDIIALAVGVSAAVGVVFGLYPALKASRLDPIQALRQE